MTGSGSNDCTYDSRWHDPGPRQRGASEAAAAPDPAVGTWELNLTKSKYNPGPAPKSMTRVYANSAEGTTMTATGVAADGSPISIHATYKYDGKDYPYSGSPNYDSISLKRVNGVTVKSTLKKSGKAVGTSTRSIAGHGKVMIITTKVVDTKGVKHEDVQVFDKQ